MGAIGCSTISELVVLKVLIGNSPFDTCGVMMLGIPNVLPSFLTLPLFRPYYRFVDKAKNQWINPKEKKKKNTVLLLILKKILLLELKFIKLIYIYIYISFLFSNYYL